MNKFKVITGTAEGVEKQLNNLEKHYDVSPRGMSTSDNKVTVIVALFDSIDEPDWD